MVCQKRKSGCKCLAKGYDNVAHAVGHLVLAAIVFTGAALACGIIAGKCRRDNAKEYTDAQDEFDLKAKDRCSCKPCDHEGVSVVDDITDSTADGAADDNDGSDNDAT